MNKPKEKLYRKKNWARGAHRNVNRHNLAYRDSRHTKFMNELEVTHLSIKKNHNGYDYTPLFRFLLSKVGQVWNEVYSEAKSRLDKEDPIFWMVKLHVTDETSGTFCSGDTSEFSTLKVDDNGLLQLIDENARPWPPRCTCCTYTFNGKVFTKDDYSSDNVDPS